MVISDHVSAFERSVFPADYPEKDSVDQYQYGDGRKYGRCSEYDGSCADRQVRNDCGIISTHPVSLSVYSEIFCCRYDARRRKGIGVEEMNRDLLKRLPSPAGMNKAEIMKLLLTEEYGFLPESRTV